MVSFVSFFTLSHALLGTVRLLVVACCPGSTGYLVGSPERLEVMDQLLRGMRRGGRAIALSQQRIQARPGGVLY